MKEYRNLFFDLDGTVSESFEGIRDSFAETFKKFGVSVPESAYRTFVGPPISASFSRFIADKKTRNAAADFFREIYFSKNCLKCTMYAGIKETLTALKARGYKIYTGTSKREEKAKKVLEYFGVLDLFDRVYGASETCNEKEEVLAYALADSGADKTSSLLIGDTYYDLYGAKIVGIDCAWVTYGYGDFESLQGLPFVFKADAPLDLLDFL